MIKTIHYVWLGKNPKPDFVLDKINSWKKFCPDYEIKEWNEDNIDFSNCKYAVEAYEQKKYAFVSDYIRIKVLYEYGGLYLDTDVELVKNPEEVIQNNQSIMGFETKTYLATNFIYSEKNQDWLKKIIDYYEKISFKINKNTKKPKLNLLPNTYLITAFLEKYYGLKKDNTTQVLSNGLKIYSQDYFSPKDIQTRKITLTENTISIHHFSASWTGEKFNSQQKFLKSLKKVVGNRIFDKFEKMYTNSTVKKIKKKI